MIVLPKAIESSKVVLIPVITLQGEMLQASENSSVIDATKGY